MKIVSDLFAYLKGKKSYITAGLIAAFTFAKVMGWITEVEFQAIMGFLGAVGLYALRSAIT